jgi:hypothetical protein
LATDGLWAAGYWPKPNESPGGGGTRIGLDTFEFQARGFYEKLGFELFGTLDDHPVGHCRFFLCQQF